MFISALLILIFAFIFPPLAVYMMVGLTFHFWLNLILTILGYAPGIIHALYLLFFSGLSNVRF